MLSLLSSSIETARDVAWDNVRYAHRWGMRAALERPQIPHARDWAKFLRMGALLPQDTKRDGYSAAHFTVDQQDTLAQHSFTTSTTASLLALFIETLDIEGLDREKVYIMTPNHDVHEVLGGDIGTPRGQSFPDLKTNARHVEALNRDELLGIFSLRNCKGALSYQQLTQEELQQQTDTAIFVKICDRLEAVLHMRWVSTEGYDEKAEALYQATIYRDIEKVQAPQLKAWLKSFCNAFEQADRTGYLGRGAKTGRKSYPYANLIDALVEIQTAKHVKRAAWAVAGLRSHEIHTIADHGHATTMATWLIGEAIKERGIKWNQGAAMELAMYQELGKIYGGDISVPSTDHTDKKRVAAHAIRKTTFKIFSQLFTADIPDSEARDLLQKRLEDRHTDALKRDSDEAKVMMVMSRFMDIMFYDLTRRPYYDQNFHLYVEKKIFSLIADIKNAHLRYFISAVLREWLLMVEQGALRMPAHALTRDSKDPSRIFLK